MRVMPLVAATVILSGCVVIAPTAPENTPTIPAAVVSTVPGAAAPVVQEPAPLKLTGTGKEASKIFRLESGAAVFSATHQGEGYFGAWLLDSAGKKVELIANGVGQAAGAKVIGVGAAGDYLLDVDGSSSWTVDIKQPRPQSAEARASFSGSASAAEGPFSLGGGLKRFSFTHAGKGYFGVWLVNKDGVKKEMIANGVGAQTGSKAAGVTEGIYFLAVEADGDWAVKVE